MWSLGRWNTSNGSHSPNVSDTFTYPTPRIPTALVHFHVCCLKRKLLTQPQQFCCPESSISFLCLLKIYSISGEIVVHIRSVLHRQFLSSIPRDFYAVEKENPKCMYVCIRPAVAFTKFESNVFIVYSLSYVLYSQEPLYLISYNMSNDIIVPSLVYLIHTIFPPAPLREMDCLCIISSSVAHYSTNALSLLPAFVM